MLITREMARSVETGPSPVNLMSGPMVDEGPWRRWLARLWPGRCLLCGGRGAGGRDLCSDCARALPANPVCCPRCGLPLPAPAPACGGCIRTPPAFAWTLAPYRYAFPLDRLLSRFKYSGDLAAGRLLGQLLGDALAVAARLGDRDVVAVPVPLARDRLVERGYNQALELARPLARRLEVPLAIDGLARTRPTPRQAGLSARERRRNLRGAFIASPAVRGQRVLLVDDVMTTGSTLGECARVLRRAGAVEVGVVVVARAPLKM